MGAARPIVACRLAPVPGPVGPVRAQDRRAHGRVPIRAGESLITWSLSTAATATSRSSPRRRVPAASRSAMRATCSRGRARRGGWFRRRARLSPEGRRRRNCALSDLEGDRALRRRLRQRRRRSRHEGGDRGRQRARLRGRGGGDAHSRARPRRVAQIVPGAPARRRRKLEGARTARADPTTFALHARAGRRGPHRHGGRAPVGTVLRRGDRVRAVAPGAPGARWADLETVFAHSDVLSLHCPLTAETANLVNAARLASMKQGALLVNVSRGGLVDRRPLRRRCARDGSEGSRSTSSRPSHRRQTSRSSRCRTSCAPTTSPGTRTTRRSACDGSSASGARPFSPAGPCRPWSTPRRSRRCEAGSSTPNGGSVNSGRGSAILRVSYRMRLARRNATVRRTRRSRDTTALTGAMRRQRGASGGPSSRCRYRTSHGRLGRLDHLRTRQGTSAAERRRGRARAGGSARRPSLPPRRRRRPPDQRQVRLTAVPGHGRVRPEGTSL